MMTLLAFFKQTALGKPQHFPGASFRTDTEAELDLVCCMAKAAGAFDAVRSSHWADGGAGAVALGQAVQKASEAPSKFKFLYDLEVTFCPSFKLLNTSWWQSSWNLER